MADDRGDFNIAHVAGLARLRLTPDEQVLYRKQLGEILAFAAQVQAVDTGGVAPMAQAGPASEGTRPDAVTPSLSADEATGNAPDTQKNPVLFRVPKVLG